MTPTLLLLLLLAQTEGSDIPPQAAPATASAERWHSLTRGEATTLVLLPRGSVGPPEGFVPVGPPPRPAAFASVGLGVEHAR
jgi:hypothetical protein